MLMLPTRAASSHYLSPDSGLCEVGPERESVGVNRRASDGGRVFRA